jgi:predicted RNase H-like HicB family nuclease
VEVEIIVKPISDGVYHAVAPSMPGCEAFGSSQREAQDRMKDAIAGYIASLDAAPPERVEEVVVD